jgi:hypothetical protein
VCLVVRQFTAIGDLFHFYVGGKSRVQWLILLSDLGAAKVSVSYSA